MDKLKHLSAAPAIRAGYDLNLRRHGRVMGSGGLTSWVARARAIVLPLMLLALALYVALHSPVRAGIAAIFGQGSRGCYFECIGDVYPDYSTAGLAAVDAGSTDSLVALLGNAVTSWLLVVVSGLAGGLMARWFTEGGFLGEHRAAWREAPMSTTDIAAYEGPLIFGLSTLALIVLPAATLAGVGSGLGLPLLRPPLGPLLSTVPAAVMLAFAVTRGWRPRLPQISRRAPGRRAPALVRLVAGLAGGLLLASIAISLTHPANGGDAVSYHAPLAVFLWREGNLSTFLDRAPDFWALAHPGSAELWFGLLNLAGGERLADLGQLPFALLGAGAAGAFTRRLGLGPGAALLAGCAFLFVPIVVMQVGQQPNDVVAAGLLMTTMALAAAPPRAGSREWSHKRLAAIGLGLGLVTVTKLALLPCVLAVGLFVTVVIAVPSWRAWPAVARQVAVVAVLFLIAVAPWWARNIVRYGNPVFPAALPVIGRGVVISQLGRIDTEFVPGPLAWPLYPFLEPLDDRTGFGPLFILGLVPGFLGAAFRAPRRPLILYLLVWLIMLPAWWVFTLHEPRFLLALFGLGMAFLPYALLTIPRNQRRYAWALVAVTALFSVAVTADQALLPAARQPANRAAFYNRVWGVDPTVMSLPENEGLLYNTGYAPTIPEYAAYYPLLGPGRTRLVLPIDIDGTTAGIVDRMRRAGIRYAYVAAAPQARAEVQRIYPASLFDVVHISVVEAGEKSGARRYLYRPVPAADQDRGTWRYLFRLKDSVAVKQCCSQ